MEQVYIFTHIPKTAGTSIRNHFALYLKNHVEFIHLANRGHKQAERKGYKNFYKRSRLERNKAKVILGHQVDKYTKELVDKESMEVVIFREPIAWEISRFNQYANRVFKMTGEALSLDDWFYATKKLHSQFDWFLINYAKVKAKNLNVSIKKKCDILEKELSHFDYIISLSSLDDLIEPILKKVNVPSSIDKKYNSVGIDKKQYYIDNRKNREQLKEICKNDVQVYKSLLMNNIIKS